MLFHVNEGSEGAGTVGELRSGEEARSVAVVVPYTSSRRGAGATLRAAATDDRSHIWQLDSELRVVAKRVWHVPAGCSRICYAFAHTFSHAVASPVINTTRRKL